MPPSSKRQGNARLVWVTSVAILLLAALYLVQGPVTRQPPAAVAPALEPTFSPPGGYYDHDIQLTMHAPDLGAGEQSDVIFTVGGSLPTRAAGTVYTQPIRLSAMAAGVTVIRACAVLPSGELGPVVSASYFMGLPATLPMVSLIMDPDDLWGPERGIYANPHERGEAWERAVDVTYVDKDRRSGFHLAAGIRIHGGYGRYFDKQSLRLYFRQEYGASRLEYPLFAGSEVRSFKRLVLHSGGQDWHTFPHMNYANWTLIRNQLAASLAFELQGYASHSQPALLFINGEPWGIYQIRERMDSRFLADHYGIESADYLETPELLGFRSIHMGNGEHWDHLMGFIETHDLADPANYAYVQTQIDIANFVDYTILQIYAANIDWPHHNMHQFRPRVSGGRWQWMLWDIDHGFGANSESQADLNLIARAMDYDYPTTGGRDALLLRKLLENPTFAERFFSRTADLLNTTLASTSIIARIDALAAELEPDIAYETVCWSSSVDWRSNIEDLRDFARRRPDFVRQHIVERFNLKGTAQLILVPPASGSGTVAVNDILIQNLPWQGVYFQGTLVQITAAPTPGYRFAGWDPPNLPQTPTIALIPGITQTLAPRFEPVGDDVPRAGDVAFTSWGFHHETADGIEIENGGSFPPGIDRADWFELQVMRPGGVDLRGWRVTDNDTKTATDEGSLIFTDHAAFAHVPRGTTILVIVNPTGSASPSQLAGAGFPQDVLSALDRRMVLHTGNARLDTRVDPGFNLGPHDNLVLLAPGSTKGFGDDLGIAFVSNSSAVTQASFGVLVDGVLPTPAATSPQPEQ